VNVVAQV